MNVNIDAKALVLDWMSSEAFIPMNKHVARQIGIKGAVLLSETINQYKRWNEKNRLTNDNQFFWTEEDCEKETTIPKATQQRLFKAMEDMNLLLRHKKRYKENKTTRYIELYFDKIAELMIQDDKEAKRKIALKYEQLKQSQKKYFDKEDGKSQNETCVKKAVISGKFHFETCRKLKVGLAQVSKWGTSKNLSFSNKVLSIKKENQSIKEMIGQLELPGLITRVLEKNLERLIDSSIDLEGILIRYHKCKEMLPIAAFADVLRRTFIYYKNDFDSYLDKSLEAEVHSFAKPNITEKEKPAVREERSPDHLKEEYEKKMPDEEYLEKQKLLKDMLSKYKK